MPKIFAIGDIHGCYKSLMALMKKLPIDRKRDIVVFLGDYIDRGPRSRQVIERLMKWEKKYPHWVFLFGNHEDLMLDSLIGDGQIYHSYDLWFHQGGKETFESYVPRKRTVYEKSITQVKDVISWEHLNWLRLRPHYFDSKGYFFVHAGVVPDMSLKALKKELDKGTYEFEQAVIWTRDLFIDSPYDWKKKIIFGHTATPPFDPIIMKNKIGIDTAVCNPKGKLTAIELPSEKFYFQNPID